MHGLWMTYFLQLKFITSLYIKDTNVPVVLFAAIAQSKD